ncbi:hypothetical protein [Streptomyces sp. CBMA156]|uniref:hypothetical protein n=1 Tax=Streptomyces sp. CBMA156 TaxID=1930280 RepID=UPI0016619474|nr:hypothetical protein [Streptomyces sp. CBMA156]MBD0670402.1 hypothetical protein [Streptomyces sp. CBMA156]
MTSHSTMSGRAVDGRLRGPLLTASPESPSAVAGRAGVPVALLVSATVARTGVRVSGNSGTLAVTCSYLDASFTRVEQAAPGRGPEALLASVLPGVLAGEARVFVESNLQPAVVATGGGWRAYALEVRGWLLLAVVPDRPGVGSAPHLHLVKPGVGPFGSAVQEAI